MKLEGDAKEGEEEGEGLGVGLDQEEEWKEVMGLIGRVSSGIFFSLSGLGSEIR